MLAFKSLKFKTDVSLFNKIVTQNINKLLKTFGTFGFLEKRAYDTIDRKNTLERFGHITFEGGISHEDL